MPELPDITVYIEALERRVLGQTLQRVELLSPFLLRTADPPLSATEGATVSGLRRVGKRIAIALDGADAQLWLVVHLMIAGRLQWLDAESTKKPRRGRNVLAHLQFSSGVLTFTEAGTKKRASLHLVAGDDGLAALDPQGLEVLASDLATFSARLTLRNHTLKRALTDPSLFSGIGNAYSDEILHAARLSPVQQTQRLAQVDITRLYKATLAILERFTGLLREQTGDGFPEKVTAFRPEMAVHGRYGQPCPECGSAIQRIRYVANELNYCPRCQTGGRLLADRALSRLLKKDWPKTIEALENARSSGD